MAKQAARTKGKGAKLGISARRRKFIDVLRRTNNVSHAAREAGIAVSTVYRYRAKVERFRTQWDEAVNEALDQLEAALMERALQGVEKKVFFGGKACGTVRHYSDALAMFMLRSKRPEIYARGTATGVEEAPSADLSREEAQAEIERRLRIISASTADGA